MTWCGAITRTLSYIVILALSYIVIRARSYIVIRALSYIVIRALSYIVIRALSYIVIRTLSYIVILNLIEDPYTSGYLLRRTSLNQRHSLSSRCPIGVGYDGMVLIYVNWD